MRLSAEMRFIFCTAISLDMAKSYKITSDPFYVNGSLTMTGVDTYSQGEISLPLDSLNQEGVLVHAIYFTSSRPELIPAAQFRQLMQVTTTSKGQIVNANDANLLARREISVAGGVAEFSGPHVIDLVGSEGPYQEADNLGIVATDNIFVAMDTENATAVGNVEFRAVMSRIKIQPAAYAALVTNELSS